MRRCPAVVRRLILLAAALIVWPPVAVANDEASGPKLSYDTASYSGQWRLRPYLEVQGGVQGVRHEQLDVFGPFASIRVGTWLRPGIGIELFADTPIEYGDDNGFEAGVADAKGAVLRLQSPPSGGLAGYVLLGYADYSIHQEPERGGFEQEERFTGLHIGIGLMERLEVLPSVLVTAEYRHYYVDEPLQVDALALGLRLDIP